MWLVNDINSEMPRWVKKVPRRSYRALMEVATAGAWVCNIRNAHLLPKKNGQLYLQTWHASSVFASKLAERDDEAHLSPGYINCAKYDGSIIDGALSQCPKQSRFYRESFWLNANAEILEFGGPREDCLFQEQYVMDRRIALRQLVGVSDEDYVVLYAPTFRDDGSTWAYRLDFSVIVDAFERRVGRHCVILVRLHPNAVGMANEIEYGESVIDFSAIGDANDAVIICDALLTDYSTIVYEASLLGKPSFYCAIDRDEYAKLRSVDPDSYNYPFIKASSCEELAIHISTLNFEEYQRSISAYLTASGTFDDGNASVRTVDWLVNKMGVDHR